jgi:topoisomerase-4 subunit A
VGAFEKINVKEVTRQNIELKYDKATGYMGTAVAGKAVCTMSQFDRVLVVKKNGTWLVKDVHEKEFVGEDAWFVGIADKETLAKKVFTIVYKDTKSGCAYIKRCVIEGWIMNKEYSFVPEGANVLLIDTYDKFEFTLKYAPKPRLKILEESFKAGAFAIKGIKAGGTRLSSKEVKSASKH